MNILIVDDNRPFCRFLSTWLQSKGHKVATLTDPAKVMSWLELNECDAITLDIRMPGIDGVTLLRDHIRPLHISLPVIIFTCAGYEEELMQDCKKAGANDYVSKGEGPVKLYSAIIRAVTEVQSKSLAKTDS